MDHGIDFFFGNRSHALKFVDFVGKGCPIKSRNDKQLVSHDEKSSTYSYKIHFFSLSLGNMGPLVLCTKISENIVLLHPLTLRMSYMVADQYWMIPFKTLLSSRQFWSIRTHLGHLLNPDDYALGYDLYGANNNDIEIDKYKVLVIPDAILIKKSYEEKRLKKRCKPRAWKLKSMNMEVDNSNRKLDEEKMNTEYEEFLIDLEENPEMMFNISLYHDDGPLPLDQMLAGLQLGDEEEEENNNGKA
ncbi:hypothetical protein MKX01_007328 [Papaver californicum]|nr:hypothetical protein MKX01_007328 [Papaver californicum]